MDKEIIDHLKVFLTPTDKFAFDPKKDGRTFDIGAAREELYKHFDHKAVNDTLGELVVKGIMKRASDDELSPAFVVEKEFFE